jgi:hypothetical protein
MSVVSSKTKAGIRYANFGCSAHQSKGSAICPNGLTVSERKVNAAVLDALRSVLLAPEAQERFLETFKARLATGSAESHPVEDLEAGIRQAQHRISNLTRAVAEAGWSAALAEALRVEEGGLQTLLARRAAQRVRAAGPKVAAHPETVRRYLSDLAGALNQDVEKARVILARHLGPVTMTAKGEGPGRYYLATGAFNLYAPLQTEVRDNASCGGRI